MWNNLIKTILKFLLVTFSLTFYPLNAFSELLETDNLVECSKNTNCLLSQFVNNFVVINEDFETIKKIPNLTKEFKSSGKFKFIKNKGFIWKEESPAKYIFISTKEKYCVFSEEDGKIIEKSKVLKELPYFNEISKLVEDLLNNDYEKLTEVFNIHYKELNGNLWDLELNANVAKIKKFINKIIILGNLVKIQSIEVLYSNGTKINFKFSKAKVMLDDKIECKTN